MKLRILLIAYACKPNFGTEYGVGWHFFKELSQLIDVHLITEAGPANDIRVECERLGIDSNNISFIDIGSKARRKCDSQGSWSFYIDYRSWQLRALEVAKQLVRTQHFDLVHHLNMIGFREPGFMHQLGLPFVLGPLGGFGGVPTGFLTNLPLRNALIELMKRFLNHANMRFLRVRRAILSAKVVIAAVPEAQVALKMHFGIDSHILPETGCSTYRGGSEIRKNILWVGKEVHRKMFGIAAQSFLQSRWSASEQLLVIGDFSPQTRDKWRSKKIVFLGKIPHAEVFEQLGSARALLFPSVHEGNPHVVYEAISCGTPVICHDSYGMGNTVSGAIGLKVQVHNYERSVMDFTTALDELSKINLESEKKAEFHKYSEDNSWGARARALCLIYHKALVS